MDDRGGGGKPWSVPYYSVPYYSQSLLDRVKTDLNLTQGEVTMFIPDMPNVPPQGAPVLIAQANQQAGGTTTMRTLGVCAPSPSDHHSLENVVEPITEAQAYFRLFEHRTVTGAAITTISQQPKHGVLRLVTEADRGTLFDSEAGPLRPELALYAYLPEQGYLGTDTGSILVDFGNGNQVRIKYYFQAIEGMLGSTGLETLCSDTGVFWKISSTLDANGNSTLTSVEYQSPVANATATTLTPATQ